MTRLLSFCALFGLSYAATVYREWDIGWITAAPDGFSRPVIAVNGQWPPPLLEANVGDTVVVRVKNSLGDQTTSLHWHGISQRGSNSMDGAVGVTQCPIPPGGEFTYKFQVDVPGAYWWHSHDRGQYPDGLRGPMIVHDHEAEAALGVDEQYTMTISDWYHDQMPGLIARYLGPQNQRGTPPIPQSGLINDALNPSFNIQPGKKYLFRIISMSALINHFVQFEDHNMTIVAVDGVSVEPRPTSLLLIAAAQRYTVIITGKENPTKNYAAVARIDDTRFPDGLPPVNQVFANLNYGGDLAAAQYYAPPTTGFVNDMSLVPVDAVPLFSNVDHSVSMTVNFARTEAGWRYKMGSTPYVSPKVPTLYTAMTTGDDAWNPEVYGASVNPYIFGSGKVVEIRVNNADAAGHPFHLHGREFQVVGRTGGGPAFTWNGSIPPMPMRRDTVAVPGNGSLAVRFKTDSPGVYLFHCHMEWHVEAGMSVTIIEDPSRLQEELRIPKDHLESCKALNIPVAGNCAGNVENLYDTSQCNNAFPTVHNGAKLDRTSAGNASSSAAPNATASAPAESPSAPAPTSESSPAPSSESAPAPTSQSTPEPTPAPSPEPTSEPTSAAPSTSTPAETSTRRWDSQKQNGYWRGGRYHWNNNRKGNDWNRGKQYDHKWNNYRRRDRQRRAAVVEV